MSKGTDEKAQEFHANLQEESGRGFGLLATLAILTIVGIAIWFIVMNQDEA